MIVVLPIIGPAIVGSGEYLAWTPCHQQSVRLQKYEVTDDFTAVTVLSVRPNGGHLQESWRKLASAVVGVRDATHVVRENRQIWNAYLLESPLSPSRSPHQLSKVIAFPIDTSHVNEYGWHRKEF
jgi:hypothetical protein